MSHVRRPIIPSLTRTLFFLLACIAAAGCELLPGDGPSSDGFRSRAFARNKVETTPAEVTRYALIDIDTGVARQAEEFYRRPHVASLGAPFAGSSFGLVGVGDMLRVTLWEGGEVGLLSGRDRRSSEVMVRVDTDGTIAVPYAGRFVVAGRRLADVEATIIAKLQGQAVQPQVTVVVAENVSNSVSVQGEVARPGSYPVVKANQRILDLVAMAGGTRFQSHEVVVRLTRGKSTTVCTLQEIIDQPEELNIPVWAGDALLLSRIPLKFLAFGSVAKPGDQAFSKGALSLGDALGQVWGLDPSRSDARGVFLFRREPVDLIRRYGVELAPEDTGTIPIVYQLNLREPKSFFAMSSFPVRPGDIVYVATSPLTQISTFFEILSGATRTVLIPRTLRGIGDPIQF